MSTRYSSADNQEALTKSVESQHRMSEQLHPTDMQQLTPLIDDESQWMHMHTSPSGMQYFHPMPSNYPQIPMTPVAFPPSGYVNPDLPPSNIWSGPAGAPTMVTTSMPLYNTPASTWPPVTNFSVPALPQLGTLSGPPLVSPSQPPTRQASPGQPNSPDLSDCGVLNPETRTWTCRYPSCSSKAIFNRPCDLRKHFNRHSKNFFCRHEGCPQAYEGGFSSKKDRLRHESKHNPGVTCEWDGCERLFSRVDNMRNHMSRIHLKQKTGRTSTS